MISLFEEYVRLFVIIKAFPGTAYLPSVVHFSFLLIGPVETVLSMI